MKRFAAILTIVIFIASIGIFLYQKREHQSLLRELEGFGVIKSADVRILFSEKSDRDSNVRTYCAHSRTASFSLPVQATRTYLKKVPTEGQKELVEKLTGRQVSTSSLKE